MRTDWGPNHATGMLRLIVPTLRFAASLDLELLAVSVPQLAFSRLLLSSVLVGLFVLEAPRALAMLQQFLGMRFSLMA